MRLEDKVAIVTDAASGIGEATARFYWAGGGRRFFDKLVLCKL